MDITFWIVLATMSILGFFFAGTLAMQIENYGLKKII
jgi:hypothetical protein